MIFLCKRRAVIIWSLLCICLTCTFSQIMILWNRVRLLPFKYYVLDIICVLLLISFLYTMTNRLVLSISLSSFFAMALSVLDYFVYRFRGIELSPVDFFSAKTAINVASNYVLYLESNRVGLLLLWLSVILFGIYLSFKTELRDCNRFNRCKSGLLFILLYIIWYMACSNIAIKTWDVDGSLHEGFFVSFSAKTIEILKSKKPDTYSLDHIKVLEKRYREQDKGTDNIVKKPPNIIVIMDESFADLRVLGNIRTEKEVTPFIDSLKINTIKGYALSSVYGGNTANTEYEYLTGNTIGFINADAIVFSYYLNKPTSSMFSFLHQYGYQCIMTHPFYSNSWNRSIVYPLLGCDEMSFIDEYPQKKYVRCYISDDEMVRFIINEYKNKKAGQPLSLYGITIQNHGGYDYVGDGYTPKVSLKGYSKEFPEVEQYLGLINESDHAIEELVTYFQKQDEDTLIMFFGDHFPSLDPDFYQELHGGTFNTLDEKELLYKVPFFIWTNYDINEQTIELTSMNFLSTLVYKTAGLPLPPFNTFLEDVQKVIPAINSKGYYSLEKESFVTIDEASGKEKEILNDYHMLEYNALFEKQSKRSEYFFSVD